jgi:ubiquitin-protein ligase E3 C
MIIINYVLHMTPQGLPEAGIDGGGIFKEFIVEFARQAFDPANGLWKETQAGKLYPNPRSGEMVDNHLSHFAFIGRMLAMSVHEGVLVEPELADFFLNSVLGKVNHIHDLQSLDPELYRNLMQLKQVPDPSELCLTFSLTDDKGEEVELMQGGSLVDVTRDNFVLYIARVAHHKLNVQLQQQSQAFRRGFNDLIDSRWMQMFQPRELQNLIGGTDHGYEVADLETHCTYGGGYHPSQPYIQSFWRVMDSFTSKERALLLAFVTSCPRPPLRGFQALKPRFTVYQVRIESDADRLPTASTCVNLLKLPTYSSEEVLRAKLLFVITSEAGFEFS